MVTIVITVLVFAVSGIVAVPVSLMPIVISVAITGYLAAAVPTVVTVMVVAKAAVVAITISVSVVVSIAEAVIIVVTEARIIAQSCVVRTPPFPVFPLALTAQAVVFDIVVTPLCQPLAVGVVVIGAAVIRAATSVIRTGVVSVLGAPGKRQ